MSKPDAPATPDYAGAARLQGAANLESARATSKLSNPEWDNAEGTRRIQYGVGGDPDRVRIIDSMSPRAQEQYDLGQGINTNLLNTASSGLDRVTNQMATPFNMSQVPNAPNLPQSSDATRSAVANALMSRLNPQFQRDEEGARTRMAAQGITQGSEAWNNEMNRLTQAKNDASMQAQVQAGGEQSRLFGEQIQGYNAGQQGRQQSIQEQAYLRNLPLSEINALRTGNMPNMPQFQGFSGSQVQAAPLLQGAQLQGQNAMDVYNAKVGSYNSLLGAAGQLGGTAAMMASDRRLKTDISLVGKLDNGLNVYKYRYKAGGPMQVGVMADEVERINPGAVGKGVFGGFDGVDYGKL